MRKIRLTFFLICASMMAFAQLPKQYLGLTTNLVEVRNTLKIDSSFVLPLRDTTFPTGQTVYNEGGMVMKSGVPYYHNGAKWNAFGGIFDSTSLSNRINLKLNISDTTAMLNPYLKKVDTTAMLNPYLKKVDTTGMLNPYLKKIDTASLSNRINARVKYTDSITTFVTPTMLNDSTAAIRADFPVFSADTNALTTNTTMSSTLDTVQRNGVNSALHLSTVGVKILSNGIGAMGDTAKSLRLVNQTAATIGTPVQISPYLFFEGQGLGGITSQQVRFGILANPNAAGVKPTGNLTFFSQVDGGTEDIGMFLSTSKQLTVDSNIIITDGQLNITGSIAQNIGNWYGFENNNGFASSGASSFIGMYYHGTINQTGGGSGITRGIYIAPILTNTADYRGLELNNTVGKSIVTGSAPSIFGGNITFPTFTLGATNITATGTEINYLSGVTSNIQSQLNSKQNTITFGTGVQTALGINVGTVGSILVNGGALGTPSGGNGANITNIPQSGVTNLTSDLALKAPLANPSLTGAPTAPTAIAGTNTTQLATTAFVTTANATNANLTGVITSVGNATSIASQTGTGTKFVVDNSPTLITPNIGVATATSINTGTTLNGTIFAKSSNVLSLASSNHALTVGNEASGVNFAIGLYSTNCAIQARNNGTAQSFYINPLGGNVFIGDGAVTGQRLFGLINTGSGTTDYTSIEVRNGASNTDALRLYCMGTNFTSGGMTKQDYGVLATGTTLSGLSIGTQASAPIEFYTSNTQRWVLDASGNTIITGKFTSSGGGLGYSTGAGGTFTQSTSRTTAVTLNKLCGTITMFSAAQAADAVVQFTLNNSFLEAGDYLMVQHIGNTPTLVAGSWNFSVTVSAGSAIISVRNVSNSSITEATPLRITIIKASTN